MSFIVVFATSLIFYDVDYPIRPCNIDIRRRNVVFTTNECSKRTLNACVSSNKIIGEPNVLFKMAESL